MDFSATLVHIFQSVSIDISVCRPNWHRNFVGLHEALNFFNDSPFMLTGPGGLGYGVYPGSTDDIVGRVIALNFLVFLVLFVLYVWYRIYTSPECSRGGARRNGTNNNTDTPGWYLAMK